MKKRISKMIVVYWTKGEGEFLGHIEGAIFNGLTYQELCEGLGDYNIRYCIPLEVSGFYYEDRKHELEDLARVWQESNIDFIDWSYGELAIIQDFFEKNGKRYGLTKTFRENGII